MSEMGKVIIAGIIRHKFEHLPACAISTECLNFIESLIVTDHTRRDSARETLNYPFIIIDIDISEGGKDEYDFQNN